MSNRPDNFVKLSATLTLCEFTSPRDGSFGFWLYDKTRSMNLSMRAKTEREAFVDALEYYQKRLMETEKTYADLKTKVDAFVAQFVDDDEEHES